MSLINNENLFAVFADAKIRAAILRNPLAVNVAGNSWKCDPKSNPSVKKFHLFLQERYGAKFTWDSFIVLVNAIVDKEEGLAAYANAVLTPSVDTDDLKFSDDENCSQSNDIDQFTFNSDSESDDEDADKPLISSSGKTPDLRASSQSAKSAVPIPDLRASSKSAKFVVPNSDIPVAATKDEAPERADTSRYFKKRPQQPAASKSERDDDDDVRDEINFDELTVAEPAEQFDLDQWLRDLHKEINKPALTLQKLLNTVRKLISTQYKMQNVYINGSVESDPRVSVAIIEAIEHVGLSTLLAGLAASSVSSFSTSTNVSYENFYSEQLIWVDDTVVCSQNAKGDKSIYLDMSNSPCIKMSPKNYFEKIPKALSWLVSGLLLLITSAGVRENIVIKGYDIKFIARDMTWTLGTHLRSLLEGTSFDLQAIIALAHRLHKQGIKEIKGVWNGKEIAIDKFVKGALETHIKMAAQEKYVNFGEEVKGLLASWRVVRMGTLLDASWFKHPYFFLRCGNKVLPYLNTYVKFVDAFIPLIGSFKKMGEIARSRSAENDKLVPYFDVSSQQVVYPEQHRSRILVIYGGVTLSRNLQYQAAERFFTALWGSPRCGGGIARDEKAIWELVTFDLNANATTRTGGCDATNPDAVKSHFTRICESSYKVIVITDLASDSVTPSINLDAGKIASNFVCLPNVSLVSCKYCVIAPVTAVCGGIKAMTSTIQEKDMPVGRAHGIEGIFRVVPSEKKKIGETKTLFPFATATKLKGDVDLKARFMARIHESSMMQLAPHPFLEVDTQYSDYFPDAFGNVGRRQTEDVGKHVADFWGSDDLELSD
jgi:hypothetical protein